MRQLVVYFNDIKAGVLIEHNPGAEYSFQYSHEYLKSALPPISMTLPKRNGIYNSAKLFPFFSNMLPEGGNRAAICRTQRIDEEDFFGLLSAMADKDFIGAVSVRKIAND